jgi:hypothetical protein
LEKIIRKAWLEPTACFLRQGVRIMSGGKGGSTTSQITIPEYIDAAARRNLDKAERISQIGYVPFDGADVAAFTPMQQAGFQNVADVSGAFGMATPTTQSGIMGGMPEPTTYAGGVRGYSAAPLYQEAVQTLGEQRPGQKAFIDSFFINPYTGGASAGNFSPISYGGYGSGTNLGGIYGDGSGGGAGAGAGTSSSGSQGIYAIPGYTTYGGHRDIAHEAIDKSFVDYGKSITAGTARPENNPAYNAALAQANQNTPVTFTNPAGQTITKPASQITSNDFVGVDQKTARELAAASMLAAGISDVGGGFSQDDPTTGFTGAVRDAFGNLIENAADYTIPTPAGIVAGMFDAPNSTYTPIGTATNTGGDTEQARQLAALATSPSYSIGGSTAAETAAITSDMSDEEFFAMAEGDDGGPSGASGSGTVLCTAYASMGYLPADIWSLDTRYGIKRFRQDPIMVSGYRLWAAPIARFIKTDTLVARATRAVLWPVVRAWAEEMAHTMKPKKYSGNKFGKLVMAMGEPFSYAVGATFLKRNAQKEL